MEQVRQFVGSERARDLLLWIVITAPVFLPPESPAEQQQPSGLPLWWVAFAALPLLALAVWHCRRHPLAAAAVPAALGLAAAPDLSSRNYFVALLLLSYLLGRRAAAKQAALALFAAVCAVGLVLLAVTPDAEVDDVFTLGGDILLLLALPWLVGLYMRQHAELVRTGFALAEKLQQQRDLADAQARLRERSRIAQDMHDSLGHELALIAVRAAALQVTEDIGPKGRRAAAELRGNAATATDRLREIIGVLREDDQSPPLHPANDTIAALVERAAGSGVAVTLDDRLHPVAGATQAPPPMTDRAAYRVVQEALTNAAKHAPGAPVSVSLRRDGTQAVISVVNDAPTPSAIGSEPPRAGGLGLLGLDERVRQAGGTLHAQPTDGGFAITAQLPLTPGAAAIPPGGAGTPQRELDLARRKARHSLLGALWVPALATAVLVLLTFAYGRYTADRTVLDQEIYQQLRIGERQSSVEPLLPDAQVEGGKRPQQAPADPLGVDECTYYRAQAHTFSPAYRLCFTGGHLSHKDQVDLNP